MKFFTVPLFVVAAAAVVSRCFADTIQLQPSQAILIPAPLVPSLRFTRMAYGGGEHSVGGGDSVGSSATTTYGRPSSTSSSSLTGSLYAAGDRSLQSSTTHAKSAYSAPAASSYSSPSAPQTNSAPSSYPTSASYSAPDYFSYPAQPYSAASSASPSYMPASSSAYQSYVAPAAGIPSPPCPTNYLLSCQPSMKPVPCSDPVPSSSSTLGAAVPPHLMQQGAYSQYMPQYAIPVVREIY